MYPAISQKSHVVLVNYDDKIGQRSRSYHQFAALILDKASSCQGYDAYLHDKIQGCLQYGVVRFWVIFSTAKMTRFRGVRVRCGAVLGHFQYHTLRCGLAKTITAPHLIFTVTCVVRCGLSLAKTITASQLIFAVTYAMQCIRCGLNDLELVYISNFGFFLPSPKTNFSLYFGPSFKLLNQFFFILSWLS